MLTVAAALALAACSDGSGSGNDPEYYGTYTATDAFIGQVNQSLSSANVQINNSTVSISTLSLTINASLSLSVGIGGTSIPPISGSYVYSGGQFIFDLDSSGYGGYSGVFDAMLAAINPVTYSSGSLLKDGTAIFNK